MWELLLSAVLALTTITTAPERPESPALLSDLPRGAPPAVGYVDHGTWRGTDGRTVPIPDRHGISAITPYVGGFLIADTRYFEGSVGLVRINAEGRTVEAWASSDGPAVAADGRTAWTSFAPLESGEIRPSLVHVNECARPWPGHVPLSVAGFIGADVVVVNQGLTVSLLDPAGGVTPLPRLTYAFDARDHLIAGTLGRGRGVLDLRTGDVRWRARGYDLRFSPSGRRVVMTDRDGVVVRRTADGRVLWRTALPQRGYVDRLGWEDERHLLGVATLRKDNTVLRIGRGVLERATRVASSDPDRPPFVLMNR